MSRNLIFAVALLIFATASYSSPKNKGKSFDEVRGYWRGQVQFIYHNEREPKPYYYHVGWLVLGIDSMGRVIGKSDNDCYIDGIISPMVLNKPSKVDVMVYRCNNAELNRRMVGYLNKRGEFMLSWKMMDTTYPVTISINGILFQE